MTTKRSYQENLFKVRVSKILSKTSRPDMHLAFGEKGVRNDARIKEKGDWV